MNLTIGQIMQRAHETAKAKGFGGQENRIPEALALIHSEVSEALEDWRNGNMAMEYENHTHSQKPVGFPSEMADILIRVCHLSAALGIDLEQAVQEKLDYNETRPQRHGGKRA